MKRTAQKPLPTPIEKARLDADRAEAALERAVADMTRWRVGYSKAERVYLKAREIAQDAARKLSETPRE